MDKFILDDTELNKLCMNADASYEGLKEYAIKKMQVMGVNEEFVIEQFKSGRGAFNWGYGMGGAMHPKHRQIINYYEKLLDICVYYVIQSLTDMGDTYSLLYVKKTEIDPLDWLESQRFVVYAIEYAVEAGNDVFCFDDIPFRSVKLKVELKVDSNDFELKRVGIVRARFPLSQEDYIRLKAEIANMPAKTETPKSSNNWAAFFLVISIIINIILGYSYFYQFNQINQLQVAKEQLKENLDEKDDQLYRSRTKAEILDQYCVFVGAEDDYYHKYPCSYLDMSEFWTFNKEYAEDIGFKPCPYCHKN